MDVVADGTLYVEGDWNEPIIKGKLWSKIGQARYLGTSFNLEKASLEFHPGSQPQLWMQGRSLKEVGTITLDVRGPFSNLDVALTHLLGEEASLALLDWPQLIHGIGGVNEVARREILYEGDRLLMKESALRLMHTRAKLGLDQLLIRSHLVTGTLWMEGAKDLTDDVRISYQHPLWGEREQNLSLDYKQGLMAMHIKGGHGFTLGFEGKLAF